MMSVKLIKGHKQNGILLSPGARCLVPYELGMAMCNAGLAIREYGVRKAVQAEVARRRPVSHTASQKARAAK